MMTTEKELPIDIAIPKVTLQNILYQLEDILKDLAIVKDRLDSIYSDIEEEME